MSEYIKELAIQAGDNTDSLVNCDSCGHCGECEMCINWCDLYNEKLAELIVKECAALATKEYNNHEPIHGDDLLEHFGFNFGIK